MTEAPDQSVEPPNLGIPRAPLSASLYYPGRTRLRQIPTRRSRMNMCPGELFDLTFVGRGRPTTEPVYERARGRKREKLINGDVDEMLRTGEKLQELDAHENVFVAVTNDEALLDYMDFFPEGKMKKGLQHHIMNAMSRHPQGISRYCGGNATSRVREPRG